MSNIEVVYSVKKHRERIIISGLITALVFIVLLTVSFHENAHVGYDPNRKVEWKQPSELGDQFERAIGNRVFNIQYSKIEKILWQAKSDSNGGLIVNSETVDLLTRATSVLPERMSAEEHQRLQAIIKKSMPTDQGAVMANLLHGYYFYRKEFTADVMKINAAEASEKLRLLKGNRRKNEQRQIHFFGEQNAKALFSKQNKTVNYLNDRRIIGLSEELTLSQKTFRLRALKEVYKGSNND